MFQYIGGPSTTPGNARDEFHTWATEWITSDALRSVVREFSGPVFPSQTHLSAQVEVLKAFSSIAWDFRGGKERNLARSAEHSESVKLLVRDAARALGMTSQSSPERHEYSHLLILGGLIRACLTRPARAKELVDQDIRFASIAALTGFRPLAGDEIEIARTFNLEQVSNEIQALEEGMRRAFVLTEPLNRHVELRHDVPFSSWEVVSYEYGSGVPLSLIAAPSSEPNDRRANTADTYKYWAESVVKLSSRDEVLLVTSSIYVPFQGVEAIRSLAIPYGCGIEVIAVDTESDKLGALRQAFTTENYLQEINSAIRSISATLTALRI